MGSCRIPRSIQGLWPLWLLMLALSIGGCAGSSAAPTPTAALSTQAPASRATVAASATTVPATTAPATATAAPAVAEDTFQNPVFRQDFPDPGILAVDGVYYAYATNGSGKNVQTATSTDLITWKLGRDALPSLPRWARVGLTWAPEVIQVDDQFVLYYTARDKASDLQCIGVAVSDKPDGGFKDPNEAPFICQSDQGGSIDASPFRDEDGTLYLYWKNDGNCCSKPTWLYVQQLSPDGLSLVGEPTQLVRNDRAWEGSIVEAPTMWEHEGSYYLFFSANSYAGPEYSVGYATCESAVGPCEDAPENPILKSVLQNPPVIGPGHQTIIEDSDGDTWMVYHVWEVTAQGRKNNRRFVWLDQLEWEAGKPIVRGPTTDPQPDPTSE